MMGRVAERIIHHYIGDGYIYDICWVYYRREHSFSTRNIAIYGTDSDFGRLLWLLFSSQKKEIFEWLNLE